MSTITFLFKGEEIPISCKIKEKMVTIIKDFVKKKK